jgi:hypothetical protein
MVNGRTRPAHVGGDHARASAGGTADAP